MPESTYTQPTNLDHVCPRNYEGSSGAMESDGLLIILEELHKKYEGIIYIDYVVSDDDTKMRKYLQHPKYLPTGKKNIGGSLPSHLYVPKWYADPTHRAKCVTGDFFEMTKGKVSPTRATKLDALRMKK